MLRKISPSSMNGWKLCALQWLYRKQKREGIKIDDTPRRLGLNQHSMANRFFSEVPEHPTTNMIKELAESIFNEDFDRSLSHVKQNAIRCWKNFVNFEISRLKTWPVYKPTATELRLENSDYVCIVDFVSEDNGMAMDWKTGNLQRLWEDHLIQGKINLMVLKDNGYDVDKFCFVGLMNGRALEMPQVSKVWIDQLAAVMRRDVEMGKFPKRKERDKICNEHCEFILDCEFSNVRLWMSY